MPKQFNSISAAVLATCLAMAASAPSLSQEAYPVDTVTMVVPYAAGGAGDIVGRLVAGLARREWQEYERGIPGHPAANPSAIRLQAMKGMKAAGWA